MEGDGHGVFSCGGNAKLQISTKMLYSETKELTELDQ
jgi:hypothetical protein